MSALLESNNIDIPTLHTLQRKLERLSADLTEVDEQIKSILVRDDNVAEQMYTVEIESMENYMVNIETALTNISQVLNNDMNERGSTVSRATSSTAESKRIRIKLPKFEICKFSGEHLDWIGWWSHFSQIYEHPDLNDKDRFDYLDLAMIPKTRAANIVSRYPTSAANYPLAIKALQERYAEPKLLK